MRRRRVIAFFMNDDMMLGIPMTHSSKKKGTLSNYGEGGSLWCHVYM